MWPLPHEPPQIILNVAAEEDEEDEETLPVADEESNRVLEDFGVGVPTSFDVGEDSTESDGEGQGDLKHRESTDTKERIADRLLQSLAVKPTPHAMVGPEE